MNRRLFLSVSAASLLLFTACGQVPAPATATPNPDAPRIELSTNPTPLKKGDAEIIVLVKDKDGQPVDGAVVTVSFVMTTMNMGITSGKASGGNGGRYTIKTSFDHTGTAKFTIQVDKAGMQQGILESGLDVS